MQIKARLAIQFTVLVTAILLLSFSALYFLVWQSTDHAFQKRLHDKALTSAILLLKVDKIDSALLKTIDLAKKDVLHQENITIYDENRKMLYTNNDSSNFEITDSQFFDILQGQTIYFLETDFDVVALPFHYNNANYVIISGAVDQEGHIRMRALRQLLITLFFFFIIIVYVTGLFFAGRALRPIVEVMNEVQQISPVEMSQRLSGDDKPDEIGRLISMFNRLLDRIENSFKLQKSFVSNVSHELNNPLTKITSQLEVTLLNERSVEEYKKTLQSVLDDSRDLNRLSASLLELAYINQENQTFPMTSIRVDEVLWEIRDDMEALNPLYRAQILITEMPDNENDLCIKGNVQLIKTAFANLIENACKFSDDHTAFVAIQFSSKEIIIKIADHGPGIAESEVKKIFEPFYRTNNTSKIQGHGIGLSLTQRIVAIHKGKINVNSQLGVGTEFIVNFPKI